MFVNDDLVFLHLQKAAGTFVVDRLAQALRGEVRDGHAPLTAGKRGRIVAAAVRDPWDWYVSLWSYGCMGQGELRGRLLMPRGQMSTLALRAVLRGREGPGKALARVQRDCGRDPRAWAALYASAEDPALFRRWLRTLLTLPGAGHLPDSYPALPMCGQVGFMTFRVLRLFTDWQAWSAGAAGIRTPDDASNFYRRHGIVDRVLRTERVAEDLQGLLSAIGVAQASEDAAKANASRRGAHAGYYDAETAALVLEKDRMVVETFGYTPPLTAT